MGAWSPSLDGDLGPLIGVEWVGLVCAWGTNGACVSRYLAGIIDLFYPVAGAT